MATNRWNSWFAMAIAVLCLLGAETGLAKEPKVAFDIPSKVECRDVTPEKCAAAHPTLKVIEAKFRISASFVEGEESSTVDVVYMISSPEMRLKVLDFLPNTTLESSTAEDRIEVTDSTESSDASTGDARVAYSLLSIGGSLSQSNKKTESNHYQKLAPKHLVLASGTMNRGHGVFYKLRPSQEVSLEGAKEFMVLCIIPKQWRGDWCAVTCSARVKRKSAVGSSVAVAGIEHAHIGLYLAGDEEASDLSESMTEIQLAHGGKLAKELTREASHALEALHSSTSADDAKGYASEFIHQIGRLRPVSRNNTLEASKTSLHDVEHRLARLSVASNTTR